MKKHFLMFLVVFCSLLGYGQSQVVIDLCTGKNANGTLMSTNGVTDTNWWCTNPDGTTVHPITREAFVNGSQSWSSPCLGGDNCSNSVWVRTVTDNWGGDYYYVSKSFTIPNGVTNAKLNLRVLSFVRDWVYLVNEATSEEKQITQTDWYEDLIPKAAGWLNSRTPEVINLPLAPGTYHIKVRVYTDNGNLRQAMNSNANVSYTPCTTTPAAPTRLTTSNITCSGATLSWTAANGATSYKVEYKTSSATAWTMVTSTATSYTLSGLTNNTAYNWRVTAVSSCGNSAVVTGSNFTTISPAAPTRLTTSNITCSGATLSWTAANGATSYKVEYKPSTATAYTTVTSTATSYTLSGLTNNTTYNWRVTAVSSCGNSTVVNGSNFTTISPAAPTRLTTSNITCNGATLSWTAANGATSYKVEYKPSSASTTSWTTVTPDVTATSYTLSGLTNNTTYNWRVTAVSSCGNSAVVNGSNFTTISPATPTRLTASNITCSGATLSWTAANGATSYKVEYKTSSATAWTMVTSTATSYTLSGLTNNTTYNWRVTAVSSCGNSAVVNGSNFTTISSAAPTRLTTSNLTCSGATLSWTAANGATAYKVEYKTSTATAWTMVTPDVTTTSYTLSGLINNTTYNWRVTAVSSCGNSAVVNGSNFTTISPAAPTRLTASNITCSGATLSWTAANGATSYKVEYKTSSATAWTMVTSTATSYTLSGLTNNTAYNWRVTAVSSCGNSAVVNGSNFTTISPAAPTRLTTSNITCSGATLSWTAANGATSYKVEYKTSTTSASSWTTVTPDVTTTSYTLSGLTNNTAYNWRVTAVSSCGNSAVVNGSNFTTISPAAPTRLTTSNITCNGATLSWTAANGATSYKVEYKPSSASTTSWTTVTSTATSYTLSGLTNNTAYNWRVTAVSSCGNSTVVNGSNFTTISPAAPTRLTASNITCSGATLSWTAANGATSYKVEYKTSSSSVWTTVTSTATSYTLSGLTNNTTYNWRVTAVSSCGNSAAVAGSNFKTTAPAAPTRLTTSNLSCSGVTLGWTAASGATAYIVEYKVSSSSMWTTATSNLTATTYTLSNLNGKTTYNWRVTAVSSCGNSSAVTGSNFTTNVVPPAPAGLFTSNINCNGATLNWAAVNGATSYRVEYKTSSASSSAWITAAYPTTTSYALSNLVVNTTYNWRITAINACGSSRVTAGSNFITSNAGMSAPTGLSVNNITCNGATLNWTAVSGATSYKVEYKTSSASTYTTVNTTATSYALSGLTAGTAYNWRVTAQNSCGSSTATNGANFTTGALPSAPTGLSVSNITCNGATLSWTAVSGATSYTVEYKVSTASAWTTATSSLTTTSYALSGLTANTTYNWRITAKNACGSSTATQGSNFTTLAGPSAPTGLSVSNITCNGATLSWTAVSGATSYTVEYKTSSASAWTTATTTLTTTSYALSGLTANTTYNWRITAKNACGSSTATQGSNFTTLAGPSAPTGLSVSNITCNGATLSWTAVSGATSYTVEYKVSTATNWTTATTTLTTTSYALSGLTANTTYNWRITAKNACGSSTATNGANFTTGALPSAPTGLSVSNITCSGATLSWTAVSGATSYTVEYKVSTSSTWTTATTTLTTTSYALSGLIANTTYNWRITAKNACGSSTATNGANFTTLAAAPSAPTGLSVSNITCNGATLSWTAVSGATSYTVEYKVSTASTWTTATTTLTTTSYALSGLIANTTYNWRITAKNACGSSTATQGSNFTTTCNIDYTTAPNSYIFDINSGKDTIGISIPVKKAYDVWANNEFFKKTIPTGTLSASVYWEDVKGLIDKAWVEGSGENASIKVLVNKAKGKGNAVIALHVGSKGDETDLVYWSWHIWVTDDPRKTTYTNSIGSLSNTFMDRNLGAVTNSFLGNDWEKARGLQYQWGRKDPFPPATRPIIRRPYDDAPRNIQYATNYPGDYINVKAGGENRSDINSWFTNDTKSTQYDLWNNNAPASKVKSPFDPCPDGWRVPAYDGDADRQPASPWGNPRVGVIENKSEDIRTDVAFDLKSSSIYPNGSVPALTYFKDNNGKGSIALKVYPGLGYDFLPGSDKQYYLGQYPMTGAFKLPANLTSDNLGYTDPGSEGHYWGAKLSYNSQTPGTRQFTLIADFAQDNLTGRYTIDPLDGMWIGTANVGGAAVRCVNDKDESTTSKQEFKTNYITGNSSDFNITNYAEGLSNPNSYLVLPSTKQPIEIPVNKAFAMYNQYLTDNHGWPDEKDRLSVNVYWTTNQNLLADPLLVYTNSGLREDAKIQVRVNSGQYGNAVVSLHVGPAGNSSDPVLWSWHIWVPNDDPTTNTVTYTTQGQYSNAKNIDSNGNNKYKDFLAFDTQSGVVPLTTTFMDMNLGALLSSKNITDSKSDVYTQTYGLQYQWGRKDPIPPFLLTKGGPVTRGGTLMPIYLGSTKGTGVVQYTGLSSSDYNSSYTQTTTTLLGGAQNPLTFFYPTWDPRNARNWLSDGTPTTLWGHGTVKSPFDPCPDGWRVPDTAGGNMGGSPWYKQGTGQYSGQTILPISSVNFVGSGNTFGGTYYPGENNTYPIAGWAFIASQYNIGYIPAAGYRGWGSVIGGPGYTIQPGGWLWTAATGNSSYTGVAFGIGDVASSTLDVGFSANPYWAMSVRCAKDEPRFTKESIDNTDKPKTTAVVTKEVVVNNSVAAGFDVQIYPNPNSGVFKIKLSKASDGTVQITNFTGSLVLTKSFKGQKEVEINIQARPIGVYLVRVQTDKGTVTKKIIKRN